MYQAYPNQPPSPASAPKSVRQAAYLMYAGAVMALISGIVELLTVVDAAPGTIAGVRLPPGSHVPHEFFHDVSTALGVTVVAAAVIGIAVWLWMAWKCRAGRPWARIMSTVLFGLSTFSLSALPSAHLAAGLCTAVNWLIGLGAVILLWRRSSTLFFDGPRY